MQAALILLLLEGFAPIGPAQAFHIGGVGACDSCHSMHNPMDGGSSSGSLLLASDPSSVCLNCHAGPGGGTSPSVFSPDGSALTPGGDFYWLSKTFTWGSGSSTGDSHGHNIIAQDFNLGQDLHLSQSPGGTYQSSALGCTSCHDPHGQVQGGTGGSGALPISVSGSYGEQPAAGTLRGNYRLLGDSRYEGGSAATSFLFSYDAPIARQNNAIPFGESDFSHVDYGTGMSEWCANCHEQILRGEHEQMAGGGFEHPSGSSALLPGEIISMYNSYIRTGELSGSSATAFLQFVPFERGISDPLQLDPLSRSGPNTNSRVMCLTCHRAHASAFRAMGRWDLDAALLADSHPAAGDGGVAGTDIYYSYYARNIAIEFGPTQGPFCEKCHGTSLETMTAPGQDPLLPGPDIPF